MTKLSDIKQPKESRPYPINGKLTGEKENTKLRAMLQYIKENGPTRKYDLLTKALDKTGTRKQLKGYYGVYMERLRTSGLLNYDYSTFEYSLTTTSAILVYSKDEAPALFL